MAKQQRRQERILAAQAGVKLRKPGFIERWILGVKK